MVRAVEQFSVSRGANSRVMLEEQRSREQPLLEIERFTPASSKLEGGKSGSGNLAGNYG